MAEASRVQFVDEPVGCLKKQDTATVCAVRASKRVTVVFNSIQFFLAKEASILLRNERTGDQHELHVEILRGQVLVQTGEATSRLKVDSGSVEIELRGEVILEKTNLAPSNQQLSVVTLAGQATARSQWFAKGLPQSQVISAGFQMWFGILDSAGILQQGVLQPLRSELVLQQWHHLVHPTKVAAQVQALRFREEWQGNVQLAASLYQNVARRGVASAEASEAEQERRRLGRASEQRRIRKMALDRYNLANVP